MEEGVGAYSSRLWSNSNSGTGSGSSESISGEDVIKSGGGSAPSIWRTWPWGTVVFVESMPVGGTGKVQKTRLRELFGKPESEERGA